jgi:DinB family protein
MSARKDVMLQTITADHAKCMAILNSFTPEQWERPAPSEEDAPWKARDVLAHMAVSELGQLGQITRCLAGEVTVPDDFDLRRFNRRSVQKQAEKTPAQMLADIESGHTQVLATLVDVAEGDLDKTGRHARGDVLTVEQFFIRITEHRRQHAEELQEALKKVNG